MTRVSSVEELQSHASWRQKAAERSASGQLEAMVSSELFDHTWKASAQNIISALRLNGSERVLDAGCGWGRVIHALKSHMPALQIDGFELTDEFVDRARRLLRESELDQGVTITPADLTTAAFSPATYDAFYSTRVLHYIEDKKAVLRRLHGALKPGGRGMIVLPNRRCPYRWLTYRHAPLFPIESVGEIMAEVGFRKLSYGGFGFFPAEPRLPHESFACKLDRALSNSPLGHFAGLAYVVGTK